MTDRELLELAAKAAGLPANALPEAGKEADDWPWNPLVDDGDALRLAVKLRIDLCFDPPSFRPEWVAVAIAPANRYASEISHDAGAATRRAIVRAAAEVGQGIPQPINPDLPEDNYYKSQAEETSRKMP